ncbi:hypothetical protein [Mesobacillus zeae]|uniref:Uncharacterized protein n=1 Tax=Mesobacillus zeae TaxID=1917180 RepID=A0A398B031_9BACI|nr:hypothetical protein [Mesobacillus zeae]RID83269.1 hypothetical protein D1970_17320 [Mesobacillus zeae]
MLRNSYNITSFEALDELVHSRIKSKSQIITILVSSLKIILTDLNPTEESGDTFTLRYYGLKKRMFFTIYDKEEKVFKHFSFIFPFNINFVDTNVYFSINNREIEIDLYILEILSTLCKNNWFSDNNEDNHDILSFIESYGDLLSDFNISVDLETDLWSVIKCLMTFEPGYIRYDYDVDNCEEFIHPLHHIDIYYSDVGTFKLGFDDSFKINDRLSLEEFEDILLDGRSRASYCYSLS